MSFLDNYVWLNERIGLKQSKAYPFTSLEFVVGSAVLYNILIWLFKRYMDSKKEPLNWRWITKCHNFWMAIYSGVAAVLMIYVSYMDGRFESWDTFSCHPPPRSEAYYLLCYSFYLSKVWEMFDTFCLIAAKKPVIWLHRIHHSTTLSIAAIVFYGSGGCDFVPIVDNMIVHFFMYFYFYNPRQFRHFRQPMTVLQILQFFHVLYYNYIAAWTSFNNNFGRSACDEDPRLVFFNFTLYHTFLILFINFFIQQYCVKKTDKKGKQD